MLDLELTVTTEEGTEKMTIPEYNRSEIRTLFGYQFAPPAGRHTCFLGTNMFSFSDEALKDDKRARAFDEARRLFLDNPLKYFIPQTKVALDFLNWRTERSDRTFKVLHAGNGFGKTAIACIDVLLDIIECDPSWPIFWLHGVKYRRFRGPYENDGVAVVSYDMKSHENTIWPQVIKVWTPREAIAPYLDGTRTISWRAAPKVIINKTPVYFYAMSQRQTTFESQALRIFWWDEQGEAEKFNGANMRIRRRGGRHVCSMTPHRIEGRKDTGAGSFIDKVRKGEMDLGLNVRFFQGDIMKLPDWVYVGEDKESALEEWIRGPMRLGDNRKLSEGKSRIYGDFHESSGLVLDNFSRKLHCIPRFDIPKHWTRYRYHDHGRIEPNACILIAINEDNEIFITEEFYGKDVEISEAVDGIISMSGNTRKMISGPPNEFWQEVMVENDVIRTVGDPRSLGKHADNSRNTLMQEYRKHGLNIMQGSGQPVTSLAALVQQMLMLDESKTHWYTKEMDAPRFYVFDDLRNLIFEFEHWRLRQRRSGGSIHDQVEYTPEKGNDHLMTCIMMMAADSPYYIPVRRRKDEEEEIYDIEMPEQIVCPITGI